jgi:hypothetical protein
MLRIYPVTLQRGAMVDIYLLEFGPCGTFSKF